MHLIIAIASLCAGTQYQHLQDKCIREYLDCVDKKTGGGPLRYLEEELARELLVCVRDRVKK